MALWHHPKLWPRLHGDKTRLGAKKYNQIVIRKQQVFQRTVNDRV